MKKFLFKNKIWTLLIALSFASGVFLLHEYKSSDEFHSVSMDKNISIEKETSVDEDEFESTDFYIFKNITELINDIFSISI